MKMNKEEALINLLFIILTIFAVVTGALVMSITYKPILNNLNAENAELHRRLMTQRDEINAALRGIEKLKQSQKEYYDVMASLGLINDIGIGGEEDE